MFGWLRGNTQPAEEHRSYTDAVIDQLVAAAGGGGNAKSTETAAVEFAVGMIARCFAIAEVRPGLPALKPGLMAQIARSILTSGDFLAAIEVDRQGMIGLRPAASWDVLGGPNPESWRYRLDLAGPSRTEPGGCLGTR